jgi:molybdopterin synthase catalytic subunit
MRRIDLIDLDATLLDPAAILAGLDDPACGGLASFIGRVRREHQGRAVRRLDYSAYEPMALRRLRHLALEARQRWDLGPIALYHRLGRLEIGDVAVVIVVAGGHRGECFEACRWLIEAVKAEVPIWKHEWYEDGSEAWVGAPQARDLAPA